MCATCARIAPVYDAFLVLSLAIIASQVGSVYTTECRVRTMRAIGSCYKGKSSYQVPSIVKLAYSIIDNMVLLLEYIKVSFD